MIESRDGSMTATNRVQGIHGDHIVLEERLGDHFPAGSLVFQ